jgi:hypothetical protein
MLISLAVSLIAMAACVRNGENLGQEPFDIFFLANFTLEFVHPTLAFAGITRDGERRLEF